MGAKLIRLDGLAERTGLPAAWLKREADAGRLPCIRAGRLRMFEVAAVLKALAERQIVTPPTGGRAIADPNPVKPTGPAPLALRPKDAGEALRQPRASVSVQSLVGLALAIAVVRGNVPAATVALAAMSMMGGACVSPRIPPRVPRQCEE